MYEFVRGRIAERRPTHVVLDVGGVGYRLEVPLSTFESLPDEGEVELLAHLHVREDQQKLFGFATEAERRLFLLLQKVSGVGTALALTLLSRASVADLKDAIVSERVDFLKSLKGIGPKTAQRLVTELRDSVGALEIRSKSLAPESSLESDAVQALQVLGYSPKASATAVRKALAAEPSAALETIVRSALKLV